MDGKLWFVRAGEGAAYVDDFLSSKVVAIGWQEAGPLTSATPDDAMVAAFEQAYPTEKARTRSAWLSVVRRFIRDIAVGDRVMTYDPDQRVYFLGKVSGAVEERKHYLCRLRRVQWTDRVPRDSLTVATRNSLGSIATLFQVVGEARDEVLAKAVPGVAQAPAVAPDLAEVEDAESALDDVLADTASKAAGLIEDRLMKLSWEDMQELVAGVLRAMGYRARVSPRGPDRGVDIFASPDGLGLQEPRIFVEVKHRKGRMDAPSVRSFLGGRRNGDRCLYVSTGGFSKDARYEADRASVPIELIDLERLRELVLDVYEQLPSETRLLLPLKRLYWPDDA